MSTSDTAELHSLVDEASRYYHRELMQGANGASHARFYLGERRVFSFAAQSFRLGYAPVQQNGHPWIATQMRREPEELAQAGIVVRNAEGVWIDPMAGRVIFPQTTPGGKYVGFVGRLLGTEDRKDKYLSTPVTDIFRRAEVLYRIDLARQTIISEGWALVVEGMLDAVLLWQVGQRNVVASGTTALTDAQAQILARFCQRIEVMFDRGEKEFAAYEKIRRSRGGYFPKGVNYRELPPSASDPAEYVSQQIDRMVRDQSPSQVLLPTA